MACGDPRNLLAVHHAHLMSRYREEPVAARAHLLVVHGREQRNCGARRVGALADERDALGIRNELRGASLDALVRRAEPGLVSRHPLRRQLDSHEPFFSPWDARTKRCRSPETVTSDTQIGELSGWAVPGTVCNRDSGNSTCGRTR